MIRKSLAALSIIFGLLIFGAMIYGARHHLVLSLLGESTTGRIVAAAPDGAESISRSRYNLASDLPTSVGAYRLIARFDTPQGPFETSTRLTYYQIDDLVGGSFKVKPIVGREIDVTYMADDPTRNEVSHTLPWNGFWYPVMGSSVFLLLGLMLLFATPPTADRQPPRR